MQPTKLSPPTRAGNWNANAELAGGAKFPACGNEHLGYYRLLIKIHNMGIKDFALWDLEYYIGKWFGEDVAVRLFDHLPPIKPSYQVTLADIIHYEQCKAL